MVDTSSRYNYQEHRMICCLCIEWIDFEDLYVDESGSAWDYCKPCAEKEAYAVLFLLMAGRTMALREGH